jgi:hypothetical protein
MVTLTEIRKAKRRNIGSINAKYSFNYDPPDVMRNPDKITVFSHFFHKFDNHLKTASMIKSTQYEKGVREIVERVSKQRPDIGKYIDHQAVDNAEFLIHVKNGTLKVPKDAAGNQEIYPINVPDEWIQEIAGTFQQVSHKHEDRHKFSFSNLVSMIFPGR